MCFNHDYAWFAEVNDSTAGVGHTAARCDECRTLIHPGEWRRTVHQEQYECCLACDDDADVETDDDGTGRGSDGTCDHGETFDYVCCERCHKLREAIRTVENAEGCHGSEAEPGLGTMNEEVGSEWDEYADRMRAAGLHEAAGLVEAPDADDLFAGLAFAGRGWRAGPGEYPGAADVLADEGREYELGGEG